ncbi:MAG: PTS sugar transporter subunit IIA [Acholeplasmataceae bacterium]|jgi:fructose-specific phosphotransferase system IIA component
MVKDCLVYLDYEVSDMQEFLKSAAETIFKAGLVTEGDSFHQALLIREAEITTGVGRGVAFPHAYGDYIKAPFVVLFRTTQPIDYKSIDGQPVDLFFVIGTPTNAEETHLKILSRLAQNFAQWEFREELRISDDAELIVDVLKRIFQPMVNIILKDKQIREKILKEFSPHINFFFHENGETVEPFEIHISDLTFAIDTETNNRLIHNSYSLEEAKTVLRKLLGKNKEVKV